VAFVLISLAALALETEAIRPDSHFTPGFEAFLRDINAAIVITFAVEFTLRFWSEGENPRRADCIGRLHFLRRFITIAVILAFLPELIVLLFIPHLHGGWLAG